MSISTFVGEIARPVSIISTSLAAAIAIVQVAPKIENGNDGAIYIGAVLAGLVGLYGFKAWEKRKEADKSAEVQIAQVGASQ